MAIFISRNEEGDACLWYIEYLFRYFITYIIDTTGGVALCFLMVTIVESIFEARSMDVNHKKLYRNLKQEITILLSILTLLHFQSVVIIHHR